ncbi:hypothetical protein AWI16_01395 [Enterobacter ludwigii]|nr:hypothetical protein ABR36_23600 [Enterobacter ludwigii]KUQ49536.1 hypothetical protein AWI16_01395 [Enterobacter ludwigii]
MMLIHVVLSPVIRVIFRTPESYADNRINEGFTVIVVPDKLDQVFMIAAPDEAVHHNNEFSETWN